MSAAQQDPYADASVGNIMGSNSVNVFLGLGLPWTIGALHWQQMDEGKWAQWKERKFRGVSYEELGFHLDYPDGGFMTPAGSLAYSVAVFSGLALLCIALLALRRVTLGAELGGPKVPKIISAVVLVTLWFAYLAASIINSLATDST
jgi:solute carrier family 8 (sodium/calcium exchanger)